MANRLQNAAREIVAVMLVLGVCAGLAFPQLSALLSQFVFPALFLLMTFSLFLVAERPVAVLTNPEPSVWGIMLWQMAYIPLLVILVGWVIGLAPDLHLMLLATATSGSVFAAPTIAHLFRLKSHLPVNGIVISTFLMPFTLMIFGQALDGDGLHISIPQYAWRVAIFLVLPLYLSVLINRFVGFLPVAYTPRAYGALRLGAVAALLVFCVGIMDGVADKIATDPDRVINSLLVSVGFALATVVGTICLFWSLGRDLMLAAAILSVHRNVGLTYAVVGTAAGSDFAIYVAVSQIPMFFSPLLIRLVQLLAVSRPKTAKAKGGVASAYLTAASDPDPGCRRVPQLSPSLGV